MSSPEQVTQIVKGVDVLELRADMLEMPQDEDWLLDQIALLRRHVFTPIYFSLRAINHGGRFDGDSDKALQLLKLAIKAGCEIVGIDAARFTHDQISELFRMKGMTKYIGAHHQSDRCLSREELESTLKMLSGHDWDIPMVCMPAGSVVNVLEHYSQLERKMKSDPSFQMILILQGAEGKLSRLLNRVMTSVTHPMLPPINVPGQITLAEARASRHSLSMYDPRQTFYIFGHPVAMSASPTIQNCGFRINGKPYIYERYDTPSVEDVMWKLSLVSVGGGSVTIPHKETIMQYMDELSDAAREIGAVNTVTKDRSSDRLKGDNTDWIGIKQQLLPKVKGRSGQKVGLIIGAGGTSRAAAYAFRSLGLKPIYILNRTFDKAERLAHDFGIDIFKPIKDASALNDIDRLDAVMGTLPASAGFTLPEGILKRFKPVLIEAAYKSSASGSRFTPLLQQAVDAGCDVIEGMEMLFEQGCAQCEIWTCKNAPRAAIAQALLDDRFKNDANPPKNLVHESRIGSPLLAPLPRP